ncbi:hypothetical protein DPSP01_013340 [Paraphaeosphaeria sporulosa]
MHTTCRPLQPTNRGEHQEELIICIETGDIGHRVAPHFLPDSGKPLEWLATSTTADVAPIQDWVPTLNWVYLDAHSYQLKYGVHEDSECNLAGPFDCIPQNQHLTFQDWEGFRAVEIQNNKWTIYFDADDDGLKDKVPPEAALVEIELERRGAESVPATLPQAGLFIADVEEMYNDFEEGSTLSSCDETGQEHVVGTAVRIMCTRIERTERHVKEEFLLTIPGPSMGDDGVDRLPIATRVLGSWSDDSFETEATEEFYSENIGHISKPYLPPLWEEGFIESPTPSPQDIDRLEADVIAML